MDGTTEKKWLAVAPQLLTTDGNASGKVTVASTKGYFVKQKVNLISNTLPAQEYQVRLVESETVMYLTGTGQFNKIENAVSLVQWTLITGAKISAYQQAKAKPIADEVIQAVYQQEPAVAFRTMTVDGYGRTIDSTVDGTGVRRLAVDASLTLSGGLSVDLDALSPPDQANPDNVLIAGSEDGTKGGFKRAATINANNQLKVGDTNTFLPKEFDNYTVDSKNGDGNPTQITYKQGATTVMVVTLTYDGDGDLLTATRA